MKRQLGMAAIAVAASVMASSAFAQVATRGGTIGQAIDASRGGTIGDVLSASRGGIVNNAAVTQFGIFNFQLLAQGERAIIEAPRYDPYLEIDSRAFNISVAPGASLALNLLNVGDNIEAKSQTLRSEAERGGVSIVGPIGDDVSVD